MANIFTYPFFIIGLFLIIKGGDIFVDSATQAAKMLKIPNFIIGATIVSIATTLPEIIVSVQATVTKNVDMAVGNAIGSVTANTALILGLFITFMPFEIKRRDIFFKGISMILAITASVIGSIYVLSANSGSVMIVAGFEFIKTTLYPSSFSVLVA